METLMDERSDKEAKSEEITCTKHENIKAIGTCRKCGRPICPLCLAENVEDTCIDCYPRGESLYPPEESSPQAPSTTSPPKSLKRPIGIMLLAGLQFFEAFIMLEPMIARSEIIPVIFFGMKFEGHWAAIFQVVLIIASAVIGIGFIKAWYKSWILYFIFAFISIANNLVLILVPKAMNLFISTIPEAVKDSSEESIKMYPVIIIIIQSALLWYVFRQKKYFEQKG